MCNRICPTCKLPEVPSREKLVESQRCAFSESIAELTSHILERLTASYLPGHTVEIPVCAKKYSEVVMSIVQERFQKDYNFSYHDSNRLNHRYGQDYYENGLWIISIY